MCLDQILECCESILTFLKDNDNSRESNRYMMSILGRYGTTSMADFTESVNEYYNLGYILTDSEYRSYRTFFIEHGINFYTRVIRDLKMEKVIRKDMTIKKVNI